MKIGDVMKLKKIIVLLMLLFISCSCVKDETIMTINKDKTINLEVNLGYSVNSNKKIDMNELKNKVSKNGFFIDSYHDDNFSGYRLSKKYQNINDISSKEDIKLNLADIISGNFDDSKLFKVEKGFFKNTYYANFTYDFSKIYNYSPNIYVFGEDSNQDTNEIVNYISDYVKTHNYNINVVKYNVLTNSEKFGIMNNVLAKLNTNYQGIPLIVIEDKYYVGKSDDVKSNITSDIDNIYKTRGYVDLLNEEVQNNYELIYEVNLPSKVLNSNTNSVSDDNKTLIWNANYFSTNEISYSFNMINTGNIVLLIIGVLSFIIFIIIGMIFYNKNKKDKEKFISKNTNISNIIPVVDNENNEITSINELINK